MSSRRIPGARLSLAAFRPVVLNPVAVTAAAGCGHTTQTWRQSIMGKLKLLRGAARRRVGVVAGLVALAVLVQAAVVLAGGSSRTSGVSAVSGSAPLAMAGSSGRVYVGHSYKNDVSPALREIPALPLKSMPEREAAANPRIGRHRNASDPVVQRTLAPASMPAPTLNFDGIPFPGVGCNCAPPDTNS